MSRIESIKLKAPFTFLLSAFGLETDSANTASSTGRSKSNFPVDKLVIGILVLLVLLGIFYWGKVLISGTDNSSQVSSEKTQIAPAIATKNINKSFDFPLKDEKGQEVSKLKFVVDNAEIRDEIVVKGQKASSVSGRTFLVLNLKITNSYNKTVQINTRDYIRLVVNNNEKELLAPEIHNDPVEVQATSTKYTRVAFAINDNDKNLKLRIGEPEKEDKTVVELKF